MALFSTDSIALFYSNVEAAKRWWVETFDCKQSKRKHGCWLPPLRCSTNATGFRRAQHFFKRPHSSTAGCSGGARGPSHSLLQQDQESSQFFEIRDPEGNCIEICKEPW